MLERQLGQKQVSSCSSSRAGSDAQAKQVSGSDTGGSKAQPGLLEQGKEQGKHHTRFEPKVQKLGLRFTPNCLESLHVRG